MTGLLRRISRFRFFVVCSILAALILAACTSLPSPPPSPRPVEEVMQDFTRFSDPVAMLGERPPGSVKDAAEYYLQLFQPGDQLPRIFETTHIYDRKGVLLAEIFDEGRRTWVGLDRISPYLINATIATEDSTFFFNSGIDARRIVGAAIQNAEAGGVVSGASTITMQLVRALFLLPGSRYQQSMERKSVELELARQLPARFSKAEILEMYLNLANYGHLTYGPEAAAQVYFDKSAADLSLAEATLLAGIPQQPANLNLFADFPAVKARQRVVLDLMVRHGFLQADEADAAYRQSIRLNPNADVAPSLTPHFTQWVETELDRFLANAQVAPPAQSGQWRARRAGLEVTTTLDLSMQRLAERTLAESVAALQPRYGMSNGALVALDPDSGGILAMVGSVDFDNEAIDGQVNVATSRRQPGSAIKPVLYAAALDDSTISPATVIWDIPTSYALGAGAYYRPVNYDGRFHGPVSVRSALANSYNVPAVRLLQRVGGERMLEEAHALGIASLDRSAAEYGPSLTLGAGEVTLLELTGAFRVFANRGQYTPVTGLLRVTDSLGRVYQTHPAPVQVISTATACQITDILSDNEARTPAFGPNNALHLPMPSAAKTGTTTDFRDNWTVGYTRHLVAGVWTGNNDGTPLWGSSGASGAAPIWRAFMLAAVGDKAARSSYGFPEDDDEWRFAVSPDVQKIDVCPPRVTCRKGGEYFSTDWLAHTPAGNPIADSVVTAVVVPIHHKASDASYCRPQEAGVGVSRTLTSLPGWTETQTIAQPATQEATSVLPLATSILPLATPATPQTTTDPLHGIVYYSDRELEKFHLLAWVMRHRIPVYLGPCAALNMYTVRAGDSWTSLAHSVGVTVADLQAANFPVLRQNGYLLVGDRLLLPRGVSLQEETKTVYHIVAAGESWTSLALQYDLPLRLLLTANPDMVRPFYILRPGDKMLIPVGWDSPVAVR